MSRVRSIIGLPHSASLRMLPRDSTLQDVNLIITNREQRPAR